MGYSDQPEDTTSPSTFSYHFRLFLLNLRSIEIYSFGLGLLIAKSIFSLRSCEAYLSLREISALLRSFRSLAA